MLISLPPATDRLLAQLLREQQAELATVDGTVPYSLRDGIEYVMGYLDGRPVACGGLQHLEPEVGEIKRMYVRPAHRGRGFSRLILAALEERAAVRGYHTVRLETGTMLTAALGLYRSAGYSPIPAYGEYAGNPQSACFEKSLVQPAL
ncbi:MAG TPA: GNAT family N-acetyltransferase [Rugosimonospora sp.]|nr:GNAT family N-acetyltransferase [Rugosimonospora sp.]